MGIVHVVGLLVALAPVLQVKDTGKSKGKGKRVELIVNPNPVRNISQVLPFFIC